jgi:hypothetical protein
MTEEATQEHPEENENENEEGEEDEEEEKVENPGAETSVERQEEPTDTNTLSFRDMWGRSPTFKIVLIAAGSGALLIFICMIISFAGLGTGAVNVDDQRNEAIMYKNSYQHCQENVATKTTAINTLTSKLNAYQDQIAELTNTKKNLTVKKENLTAKLNESEKILSDSKFYTLIFQIGSGVGGAIGLGTGGYGLYARSQANDYISQIAALNTRIAAAMKRIRDTTKELAEAHFVERSGYLVSKTLCYSSGTSKFNRDTMKKDCAGKPGMLIEMTSDEGNLFGAFFTVELKDSEENLFDPGAFVFSITNGIVGDIRDSLSTAFSYKNEAGLMFQIGDGEIKVSISTEATATVNTIPGKTYMVDTSISPNVYHSLKTFKIASLQVSHVFISKSP